MKNIHFVMLLFTGIVNAQIINFPDPNFKAKLLSPAVAIGFSNNFITLDANGDGEIEVSEALLVKLLRVNGGNISSLQGVENFFEMQELECKYNNLTSLNLAGMTNVTEIRCNNNQLATISLAGLTNLIFLNCSQNVLTQINLDGLTSFGYLDCRNNQINNLNFTGLNNLSGVYCDWNTLTSLDFSGNPIFDALSCTNNNLESIILKNGFLSSNDDMFWGDNPNLSFICVDEGETIYAQAIVDASNMQPVVINSYCSFVPGADYNTISGTIRNDTNNNGCDLADTHFPKFLRMNIDDGTNQYLSIVNENGNYNFLTEIGNYTIIPGLEYPAYFNINPTSGNINFPILDNSSQQLDFCITPNGSHTDLEVVLLGNIPRPGLITYYQLLYKNNGNSLISNSVNVTFDATRMSLSSANPTPDAQTSNTLTWNFSNLYPFETRSVIIYLNVNAPTDIPPVIAGDAFSLIANSTVSNEETPLNNTFTLNQIAANSYDPNVKTCLEGNVISSNYIGEYLHYNINFENIGDDSAQNIVIKDLIDTTKFDISSLQVMNSSHPVDVRIDGNKVEFIFQNINLPSAIADPIGGHGNVLFKIKTLPTLPIGTMVTNTANIYFDYNHPIETNEARTTFNLLSTKDFTVDSSVTIYPNPAKNLVTVEAKSNIKSIQIFDIQGRILDVISENKTKAVLDISSKSKGIYFIKITTETGSKVEKLVKE